MNRSTSAPKRKLSAALFLSIDQNELFRAALKHLEHIAYRHSIIEPGDPTNTRDAIEAAYDHAEAGLAAVIDAYVACQVMNALSGPLKMQKEHLINRQYKHSAMIEGAGILLEWQDGPVQ